MTWSDVGWIAWGILGPLLVYGWMAAGEAPRRAKLELDVRQEERAAFGKANLEALNICRDAAKAAADVAKLRGAP